MILYYFDFEIYLDVLAKIPQLLTLTAFPRNSLTPVRLRPSHRRGLAKDLRRSLQKKGQSNHRVLVQTL
jgi:hypothetical protein